MKTQKNSNPTLPSPVKFSIYIIAVAVLGLLNWTAINASDPVSNEIESLEISLEAALVPVAEPAIELEDWMLDFEEDFIAETEIELEDWMLIVPDPAPELEDWMVNTTTWAKVELMATK